MWWGGRLITDRTEIEFRLRPLLLFFRKEESVGMSTRGELQMDAPPSPPHGNVEVGLAVMMQREMCSAEGLLCCDSSGDHLPVYYLVDVGFQTWLEIYTTDCFQPSNGISGDHF